MLRSLLDHLILRGNVRSILICPVAVHIRLLYTQVHCFVYNLPLGQAGAPFIQYALEQTRKTQRVGISGVRTCPRVLFTEPN